MERRMCGGKGSRDAAALRQVAPLIAFLIKHFDVQATLFAIFQCSEFF